MQRKIIKCIIVGSYGAGKSQLCNRFTGNDTFSDIHDLTIGVEFGSKNLSDGSKLQIWDTAGQESFKACRVTYYRGISVALLCCDLTDRKSYEKLDSFLGEIRAHIPDAIIGLVGTKADKADKKVSDIELEEFKTKNKLNFVMTCSARNGSNIEKVFTTAVDCLNKKAPLSTPLITTDVLRAEYRANGGSLIATARIFGVFRNNSSDTAIEKMQARTAQRAGGASEITLRTFKLI